MTSRYVLPLLAAVALAGCHQLESDTDPGDYGVIQLRAFQQPGGSYVTTPVGLFIHSQTRQNPPRSSDLASNTCVSTAYAVSSIDPNFDFLNAGEWIRVTTKSGGLDSLHMTASSSGAQIYALPHATTVPLPLTPGDTVTFVVPGAPDGFESITISGKTAEPFTITSEVDQTSPSLPIDLTWTEPDAPDETQMIASLQYSSDNSSLLDQQIYCVFEDTGSGSVPQDLASRWMKTAARRYSLTRFRSTEKQVDNTFIQIQSFYDVPIPSATVAASAAPWSASFVR